MSTEQPIDSPTTPVVDEPTAETPIVSRVNVNVIDATTQEGQDKMNQLLTTLMGRPTSTEDLTSMFETMAAEKAAKHAELHARFDAMPTESWSDDARDDVTRYMIQKIAEGMGMRIMSLSEDIYGAAYTFKIRRTSTEPQIMRWQDGSRPETKLAPATVTYSFTVRMSVEEHESPTPMLPFPGGGGPEEYAGPWGQ